MKFFWAIIISLQIISGNTFVEDIARIPFLIEHYHHHTKTETPNISFLDFIAMHYSNEHADNDTNHQSLPLKHTNDVGHVHITAAFTVPEFSANFSISVVDINVLLHYAQFIPNHQLESIFQPPKSC